MLSLNLLLLCLAGQVAEPADLDPARNLALHCPVSYLPAPNYSLTARGDTDGQDLTDGELSKREDQHLWFETGAVGWSYPGRVNLAVDLGQPQPVGEVAIRFLGGSPQPGIWMPGWVEVMVADDPAGPWYQVAEYSRWTPGDDARFSIPQTGGKAWIHRLRFTDLNVRARCVGLRFYGAGLTCSDELYVFRGPASAAAPPAEALSDFTIDQAAIHFHTPQLTVAADIATPLPIGGVSAPSDKPQPMAVTLTFPAGVTVRGGALGGVKVDDAETAPAAGGSTEYRFRFNKTDANTKTLGRLYIQGTPPADGQVSWQTRWGDWEGPVQHCPIVAVELPPPGPAPRRLMAGLSWWDAGATMAWPDWDEAFRRLNFNTLQAFSAWLKPDDQKTIDFVAQARAAGWRIQSIDSPWHQLINRHKKDPSIYCQFADGSHGSKYCPAYDGPFYQEEMDRVTTAIGLLQPTYYHPDIELWGWQGPVDSEKCTRCQAALAASGIDSWADWKLAQGDRMARDLRAAVDRGAAASGGPAVQMGVYDFQPNRAYQFFWPFDPLYPDLWQSSQVSTYTPLALYHLGLIGDIVREDRTHLPRGDQYPWLTPGDAGTFPGEALRWAVLECLFNGSSGVNFWSGRVWDADQLASYAWALHTATPVEDTLIDGTPFNPEVDGPGRVSGQRRDAEIALLVADYLGETDGTVRLKLNLDTAKQATDLLTGTPLATVAAGPTTLAVPLEGQRARAIVLR